MNAGASRAARADRQLGGADGKIPREFKRAWALMSHKEKAKLRRQWNVSQVIVGTQGAIRSRNYITDQAFESLQNLGKKDVK